MTERRGTGVSAHGSPDAATGRPASFPNLFDAVPVGLCLIGRDLRLAGINRRMAEMTGRPAAMDVGRPLAEVLPAVAAQLEPHLRQALQGQGIADLELQGSQAGTATPNGDRTYLASLEPAREGGEIVGVLCSILDITVLDITGRGRAADALREYREPLSSLVAQSAVGIVQFDFQGRILLANARLGEILGREPAALQGQSLPGFIHPEDRPASIARLAGLAETGEPFRLEERYVRPDGSAIWVKTYVSAARDPAGRPQFAVATVQDITLRKQAESALRESEDHHRHAVELSPHITWTAEPDGRIVEVSPRSRAAFGQAQESLAGQGWLDFVHPEDRQAAAAGWADSLRSGALLDMEFRFRQADGDYHWVRSRAAPRRDAEGRVMRWYGIVEDVHERRLAEASLAEREEAFRGLFEANPAPMWVYDRETLRFLEVNDAAVQTYGWSREDFLGMTILDIRPAGEREAVLRSAAQPRAARKVSGPWRHLDAAGRERLVDAISHLLEFGGRPAALVTAWDVTDRVRAEEALRESEENYRYTIELSPQIPWIADTRGQVTTISPRWGELVGMTVEETLGTGRLAAIHPEDVPLMEARWARAFASGEPLDVEMRVRLRDGSYRWFRSRAAARRDEAGRILRWYGTDEDIHEHKLAGQQIRYMAYHDPLTDLANRRLFHQELERALARLGPGEHLALHCVDLDRFKGVNDTLGHAAGDALLRQAANRLRRCLPEGGLVARLGGDEFAVIQPGLRGHEKAETLARHILDVLDEDYSIDDHPAVTGASVGIALAGAGAAPEEVVRNADIALYRAKAEGGGALRFFAPQMNEAVQRKQELRAGLRKALSGREVQLHFQPLVGIRAGEVAGFEALMRWRHPDRGMIPPAEFIPVAEETGMIIRMGEWALREACREAASWPDPIRVAVNLSPVQFRSPGLVRAVAGALAETGLAAGRLELEVTESVLLQDEQASAILRELSEMGVRIGLDDFGTGFSSLAYLLRFPFDKIKIDRSFVMGLPDRRESEAVIRAVVSMSRSLGISVTAEGVETNAQLDALRRLGCDHAQGYLFSRPIPAPDARALIARRNRPGLVA